MTDENTRLPEGLELLLQHGVELSFSSGSDFGVSTHHSNSEDVLGATVMPFVGSMSWTHTFTGVPLLTQSSKSALYSLPFSDGACFTLCSRCNEGYREFIDFSNVDPILYARRVLELKNSEVAAYDPVALSAFAKSSYFENHPNPNVDSAFAFIVSEVRGALDSGTGLLSDEMVVLFSRKIVETPNLRSMYHAYVAGHRLPVRGEEE